jgi:hypothetical protein
MCHILQKKKVTMYRNNYTRTLWIHINAIIANITTYVSLTILSVEDALEIANVMNAQISSQVHQLDQIQKYTWLNESNLQVGMDRVESLGILKHDNISELSISTTIQVPDQDLMKLRDNYHFNECNLNKQYILKGSIDCVCETTQAIYEFKCTSMLLNEHYMQLAIYKYIYDITYPLLPKKKSMIYNILTDELVEIDVKESDMKMIIEYILLQNCITKKDDDDTQFINEINTIKSTVNTTTIPKKIHDGSIYAYLIQK